MLALLYGSPQINISKIDDVEKAAVAVESEEAAKAAAQALAEEIKRAIALRELPRLLGRKWEDITLQQERALLPFDTQQSESGEELRVAVLYGEQPTST